MKATSFQALPGRQAQYLQRQTDDATYYTRMICLSLPISHHDHVDIEQFQCLK